jgi:hypothetical protein
MKQKGYASISPGSYEMLVSRKQTLMVNASIMNSSNEPENRPWLVEIAAVAIV